MRGLLLAESEWLLAFQVIERGRGQFTVSALTVKGTDHEALAGRIEERFAERFGAGVQTEVRFVDELERTPGGKARVVSRAR